MEQLELLLNDVLTSLLIDLVISSAREKTGASKIKIHPVMIKETLFFQVSQYIGTQVFHDNMTAEEARQSITSWMQQNFRQMQVRLQGETATVLVSKKGKMTIKRKKVARQSVSAPLSHNRAKQYILEEGMPVPFMVDLGVMTPAGQIVKAHYDKYRQINRFLEFIEDILPELPTDRQLTMIDFGCGKSYLTFAMYYYLRVLKAYDIRIIGLDLKEKVIAHCQSLAERYGYDQLQFLCGDIADYEGVDAVDMVVTLHACDTATDYALAKAVKWGAGVILSVPCCQHELNRQIDCETMRGVFKYGLIQERTAALMTDALRGQLLELQGYKTQLLEFIDMSHTPKNILIRAVRSRKLMPAVLKAQKRHDYEASRDFLGVSPTLEKLLNESEEKGVYGQN